MSFWGDTLDIQYPLCFLAVLWLAGLPGVLLEKLREHNRLQLFPELAWVSEEEREAIWERARQGEWWMRTVLIGVGGLLAYALSDLFPTMAGVVTTWVRQICCLILMSILGGGCPFLNELWQRKLLQRRIRQEVNDLGVPLCLSCGYHLQGAAGEVCPECWLDPSPRDLLRLRGLGHQSKEALALDWGGPPRWLGYRDGNVPEVGPGVSAAQA